jgi:hypothetical protein
LEGGRLARVGHRPGEPCGPGRVSRRRWRVAGFVRRQAGWRVGGLGPAGRPLPGPSSPSTREEGPRQYGFGPLARVPRPAGARPLRLGSSARSCGTRRFCARGFERGHAVLEPHLAAFDLLEAFVSRSSRASRPRSRVSRSRQLRAASARSRRPSAAILRISCSTTSLEDCRPLMRPTPLSACRAATQGLPYHTTPTLSLLASPGPGRSRGPSRGRPP